MTGFEQLVRGFSVALSWKGLLYCFIGCLWGTVVGVLPGLGPLAGMTISPVRSSGCDEAEVTLSSRRGGRQLGKRG